MTFPPGMTSWTLFGCACEFHLVNGADPSTMPDPDCPKHRRPVA